MKRLILVAGIVLFVVAGRFAWMGLRRVPASLVETQASETTGTVTVTMLTDEYQPPDIRITKGQAVRFINKSNDWRWPASNLHPTHDIYPEFDPKEPVKPGGEWIYRFEKVGQWRMHDHLAPYITGTVTVTE